MLEAPQRVVLGAVILIADSGMLMNEVMHGSRPAA